MAGPADSLSEVGDRVHRMASDMAESNHSAENLHVSFTKMLGALGQFKLADQLVEAVKQTKVFTSFQSAIHAKNMDRYNLLHQEIGLDSEKMYLERTLNTITGKSLELHQYRLDNVIKELAVLEKQKIFAAEIREIGAIRLTAIGASLAAAGEMYTLERKMNQDLVEANSSWRHRGELLQETLMTQVQIGAGFEEITRAARALVHFNLDASVTFDENLRLVTQMAKGLGASEMEAAKLATIVERQLHGSFRATADVITEIVNSTALAADEAMRLASSIASAMGRLRPGMGAQSLPEVLKLVGRYESALKEVGGAPGAFQQLIEGLTRPEGMLGAGALQVNPEFIATSQGVQMVMDRFAKYGENLLGQSTGWQRQMQLQNLAEQFHVSADQANQMLIAIRRARNAQTEQISVQDRWREQLHATNSGITRLANSISGLLTGAMYPVSFAVAAITNTVADWVENLLSYKEVVYGIGIGLLGGFVLLTGSMFRLARSLWTVVMTSNMATAGLNRLAAANAAASLTTGVAGATGTAATVARWFQFPTLPALIGTIASWLSRIFSGIRAIGIAIGIGGAFVGTALLVAGAVAYYGYKQWAEIKRLREESHQLEMINDAKAKELERGRDTRIFQLARDLRPPNEVLAQYRQKAKDILTLGLPAQVTRQRLEDAAKDAFTAVEEGINSKFTYTPLKDRTAEEQKNADELLEVTGKIHEVNKDALRESIKKRQLQEDSEREAEIDRLKNRSTLRKVFDFTADNLWGGWVGDRFEK